MDRFFPDPPPDLGDKKRPDPDPEPQHCYNGLESIKYIIMLKMHLKSRNCGCDGSKVLIMSIL